MYDVGFDIVLEQFDGLGDPAGEIVNSMTKGWYKVHERGTFVGIKTRNEAALRTPDFL